MEKGKVIFIGAGPGDPELLTVKAVRWLGKADVVLVDRLVSPAILEQYLSPEAEVIAVGKQCRKGASTPQTFINELMVKYATAGKMVVRLKGGDVSVFSNLLDELESLVSNKIAFEIVPGITAALGAAAYAGIPLTARNYSTAVRFLTAYKRDILSDVYWKQLAATDDTLVFYMSGETLDVVISSLRKFGIADDKKLAIIEQATTPDQRVSVFGMYDIMPDKLSAEINSPALLIIGKVVALHEQFKWLTNGNSTEEYFPPVAAKLVACEEGQHAEKLLTA